LILHQPEINKANGEIVVSARIEPEQSIPKFPKELWFAFPEQYEPWVSDRSEAFLIGIIKPAMVFNEPLVVRGIISPSLAYNMEEYKRINHNWFPNQLSLIDITYNNIQLPSLVSTPSAVSGTFSGGVDSFFTLWSHLPENQPEKAFQISHIIYIQGVDTPYGQLEVLQFFKHRYSELAKRLNIQLITTRTNAKDFSNPWFSWLYMYGAAVIGTPMALQNLLKIHYVASGMAYPHDYGSGCTPLTDHLLSTETTQIIYHGGSNTKIEKIDQLGNWLEAQNLLRVCVSPNNCSRCEKCLRTITMLKVSGHLHKFNVFKQPFNYLDILRWGPEHKFRARGIPYTLAYARKHRKFYYFPVLYFVYIIGWIKVVVTRFTPNFIKNPIKKIIYPQREWALLMENPRSISLIGKGER